MPRITTFLVFALLGSFASGQGGVGYINLERALEAHPGYDRVRQEMEREREAREQTLREQAKSVQLQRDDLDLLKEGSPQHLEQLKRIKVASVELELDRRMALIEFNLRLVTALQGLLDQCVAVATEVAKERKLTSVATYTPRRMGGRNLGEIRAAASRHGTLWLDESLDLTATVETRVRERYAK